VLIFQQHLCAKSEAGRGAKNMRSASKTSLKIFAICLGLLPGLFLCTTAAYATVTYLTIDAPRAGIKRGEGTQPLAIDKNGVIAGEYQDGHRLYHGFVREPDGTIRSFDPPGASQTNVKGMSATGDIVGSFSSSSSYHAFVRSPEGGFTVFDAPGAVSMTFGTGINAKGTSVGTSDAGGVFLRAEDGTFTTFDLSGILNVYFPMIDNKGAVSGQYMGSNLFMHGFIRSAEGTITSFDPPGLVVGTFPRAIDDRGDVAGSFQRISGLTHGFLRRADGSFVVFDPPNSVDTEVYGMDNRGTIVGSFRTPTGPQGFHGFVRHSDGRITVFDPPGATGTLALGVNSNSGIVGWYYDANYAMHGFLRVR
jgi:hypothetical protein